MKYVLICILTMSSVARAYEPLPENYFSPSLASLCRGEFIESRPDETIKNCTQADFARAYVEADALEKHLDVIQKHLTKVEEYMASDEYKSQKTKQTTLAISLTALGLTGVSVGIYGAILEETKLFKKIPDTVRKQRGRVLWNVGGVIAIISGTVLNIGAEDYLYYKYNIASVPHIKERIQIAINQLERRKKLLSMAGQLKVLMNK